jgi:hypothetical protein
MVEGEGKAFFFEKKKQKTDAVVRGLDPRIHASAAMTIFVSETRFHRVSHPPAEPRGYPGQARARRYWGSGGLQNNV